MFFFDKIKITIIKLNNFLLFTVKKMFQTKIAFKKIDSQMWEKISYLILC